jgi:hypothetical protein
MRRLLGLLLIIRALAPALAVLVMVWGVNRVASDFQAAVAAPISSLENEFDALSATFETAKQQFEIAKQDIDAVLAQLRAFQLPNLLPTLPTNFTFPAITIPDLTVAIPSSISVQWSSVSFDVTEVIPRDCGIFDFACDALGDIINVITQTIQYPSGISISTQNLTLAVPDLPSFNVPFPGFFNDLRNGLNDLFSEFFDIFNVFDDALVALNELGESLQTLPDRFNGLVSEGQQLVNGLQTLLAKWSGVLTIALLLIVGLIVISFGVTFLELFGRGLTLLFERSPET